MLGCLPANRWRKRRGRGREALLLNSKAVSLLSPPWLYGGGGRRALRLWGELGLGKREKRLIEIPSSRLRLRLRRSATHPRPTDRPPPCLLLGLPDGPYSIFQNRVTSQKALQKRNGIDRSSAFPAVHMRKVGFNVSDFFDGLVSGSFLFSPGSFPSAFSPPPPFLF